MKIRSLPGVKHRGTEEFFNRIVKRRQKAKAARKARRKQRKNK